MTKLTFDAAATLALIPYLRPLPATELARLAATCRRRRLRRGAQLFIEGQPAEGLFVILSGAVKVIRRSAEGREQVLHREGPGATLGEVPVFDGLGSVASAVAGVDTLVLFLPRAPLLAALDRNPAGARAVIQVLCRRVRRFAALVENLALRGVDQRVAAHLCAEHERSGGSTFALAETQAELAAELGTVREQVSRALSRLVSSGVIRRQGRRVTVLDRARLAALAADSRS
jgi:CRP/FNR family transcriptional regulator